MQEFEVIMQNTNFPPHYSSMKMLLSTYWLCGWTFGNRTRAARPKMEVATFHVHDGCSVSLSFTNASPRPTPGPGPMQEFDKYLLNK